MKFQKPFDKVLCTKDAAKHSGDKTHHIYKTEEKKQTHPKTRAKQSDWNQSKTRAGWEASIPHATLTNMFLNVLDGVREKLLHQNGMVLFLLVKVGKEQGNFRQI